MSVGLALALAISACQQAPTDNATSGEAVGSSPLAGADDVRESDRPASGGVSVDGATPALGAGLPLAKLSDDVASMPTSGFTGEQLADGTVQLRWPADADALGYNVYRDEMYYTTVHQESFTDRHVEIGGDYRYEIHSFTGEAPRRFEKIASGLLVQVRNPVEAEAPQDFFSTTTSDFVGQVAGDGEVRLSWRADPDAAGYNVYREGVYHTTVHEPVFVDREVRAGNEHKYEIHSFTAEEPQRFERIADGLTVQIPGAGITDDAMDGTRRDFVSTMTDGFTGRVLDDGTIRLEWRSESDAAGYNVYRDGNYYTTVHQADYVDRRVSLGERYDYEIHLFTGGTPQRFRMIASGLRVHVPSVLPDDTAEEPSGGGARDFFSATSTGFTARILDDGTVRLRWRRDPDAIGYNIYRQERYFSTVHEESFSDRELPAGDYRYEIHSFTGGKPRHFRKIAGDLTVSVPSVVPEEPKPNTGGGEPPAPKVEPGDDDVPRDFVSVTTSGFTGQRRDDGTVLLSWRPDPNAEGYNIYRRGEYYNTVRATSFVDTRIFDGDYYYEIESFTPGDNKRYRTVATGLTVKVRGLGRVDPDVPVADPNRLDGYELVFADEFDGPPLDLSKWNTAFLWGDDLVINSELQHYVDIENKPDFGFDPFTFEDGNLVINSIRTPEALRDKAYGQDYLSGIITSYDSFRFTYGYAEMRARMPFGRGYWTAFWLLNARYGDGDPEIDIMEFIGHDQDVAFHTYHYYDRNGNLRSTTSQPTKGVDYTSGFHTFGVDWRPGLLIFYIDGIEVHRISDPEVSDQDMYLIANTAVGGWWPGSPDETTPFPGRYEIDYIRVYRQIRPYELAPFSDQPSGIEPAAETFGTPPNHRPPFELWPEGVPGLR